MMEKALAYDHGTPMAQTRDPEIQGATGPAIPGLWNRCLYEAYKTPSRIVKEWVLMLARRAEGGELYSATLRRILLDFHQVNIGAYSHGECFVPGAMDRFTTIGRYSSFANGCRTLNVNHPMDFKSTHGFFFNCQLSYCRKDLMSYSSLSIGSDVWLGANALILPHVRHIGDGAVVAAGAVVNKDVPAYAVVAGNPARVVRFRFPKDVIGKLLAEKWWDKPIEQLKINDFTSPYCPGWPSDSDPVDPA